MLLVVVVVAAAWAATTSRNDPSAGRPDGGSPAQAGPPRGMPVEAVTVRADTLTDEIAAVGSLQATESVVVRAEAPGRVTAIEFAEGRPAAKDAVLVRLDSSEWAAQVDQIAAAVELNRANYERAAALKDEKVLSAQAFDQAASRLKESEAGLALAKERLAKTTVRAPFAGRLGLRRISVGDYVQPGQELVTLDDLSAMKVDFRVSGVYAGRLKTGQPVVVRIDAFSGESFRGRIDAIDPRLDEGTRTIAARARIPNGDGRLHPGMFAGVHVIVGERPQVVLVPEEAIVPMGNEKYVYRVVEGKAALTKVALGQRREGNVEIVAGVKAGETVVTAGQMKIGDGAPVTVIGPGGTHAPAGAKGA